MKFLSCQLIKGELKTEGKDILQEIVYVVDTLIAAGKKIYEVVDAVKPVVNAKFNNGCVT